MKKITFPLKQRMQGAAVADLQDALQLLLERSALLANDDAARRGLMAGLQRERVGQAYGAATSQSVSTFQQEHKLPASGEVDEPTANALNAMLNGLGVLDRTDAPKSHVVSGQVRREDRLSVHGASVRAFHESDRGAIRLGEDTTDAEGRYTIHYELLPGVDGINLRVSVMSEDGDLLHSSEAIRDAKRLEIIDLALPMARKPAAQRRIAGQIMLQHGLPAAQLKLRLYRFDFGGKATLLDETSTLVGGQYAFTYVSGGKAASLEVRAVRGANEEIPLSKPLNDLSGESREKLNLVAPSDLQPLAAEYRRLSADLTPHVGQMMKLADARENNERQDLTVLNRATGWDARLIALAATAERLSAEVDVKLPQEAVYGLLRAGLPSDKLQLAQVEPDVAEQALKKVRDAGIVDFTDLQISEFKKAFTTFSTTVRLNIPAPGSRSTYGQLLKASGLSADAQTTFAPIYLSHRGDAAQLWKAARQAGLDDAQIGKLQLQGKLAFLAGNSEGMTDRLLKKSINDPAQLVEQNFHRADSWSTEVFERAGIPASRRGNLSDADKEKLHDLIPAAYTAENVEDRLGAYAEDMARKVRLSYPTQVVARLIETDNNFKLPSAHDATVTLLKNATGQGFRLGETPVAAFMKTHAGATVGIAANVVQAAQQQLQTLQRVYQITPSNEAMPVLMSLGMTSAYDVMAYSETAFTELFNAKYLELYNVTSALGSAKLIYRKAKQVSSVTYNLFTIAKKMDSEPPVAALSAPVEVRESVRNELIKQIPTMESLFGSMDFCECEHCRSVLSPAAYLVDLLQFVDAEPGVWGNFLAQWKATHGNQDYPHKDKRGIPMKPYEVLVERRPDLPNIALTCGNTHTALPYIDIVNEILEYYVANGKLEEKAVHDTGEATTPELLAEPQNVIRGAYDKLREARYPLTLPFDLWIETVRQFCNYFETPLARVLEVFRPTDDLLAAAQPFDRSAIFMESLGLSSAELAIFTDPAPLATWHALYGFKTAAEATTTATDATGQRIDLNSAKALSRRLGVTYKEIAEIIQTGFVNPKLAKLGLLYKLGVGIHDARFYLNHRNDPAPVSADEQKRQLEVQAFTQEIAKLAETFQMTTAQLEAELQAIPFDEILVLADPDAGCNFDLTTLQYADGVKKADPIAFLRINLFVRLWRKLGWSIEETDRALQAFMPKATPFETAHLSKQPLKTALIYLAHLKELNEKVRVGKQSRLKLTTLWSDIATAGKKPLYAQLFLTRSVLKNDPVFDHPLGQYLSAAGVTIKDHLLALQGSLGLTADEISRILVDAGLSFDTAGLSLPNVSLLYRYGLLAKALKLSVQELIVLKQLSGLNPFKPVQLDPLATIEQDHPFSQTLRFVEVAEEVKDSGLKIDDLDYLLRHRFDETGKYRPNSDAMLALLIMLSEGVRAIRAEHVMPDDPGAMSEEVLRQKLGLALPSDVVERFLAMMNGTAEFTATKAGVQSASQLHPDGFTNEPIIRDVSYNATRQEQKLTVRGVLFDAQKNDLKGRLPKPIPPNLHVPSPILGDLLDDAQQQARSFFEKHLRKQAPNVQPAGGFLDAADFDLLFDLNRALAVGETEQDRVRNRRMKIAQAFLPFLQARLVRQFIVQTMTAHTAADPVLVESLLTDERLLAAPGPLLEALTTTGDRGITATCYASTDGTGTPLATLVFADADTSSKDKNGNILKAAGTNSARFEGYLEVPLPGAYRFNVLLDKQNAEAMLRFDHLPDPLFWKGVGAADHAVLGDKPEEFLELKPGILYRFHLDLKKLNGGEARLLVQGETLPKDRISQLTLYPLTAIQGAERAVLLLTKSLQLVQGLSLSEREIRYLLTHAADFGGVNLSQLPTRSSEDTPAEKVAIAERFARFLRLAAYARVKRDLAGGTDDLIGIFEANDTTDPDKLDKKVYPLIARLTRRDEVAVKATSEALVSAPAVPAFESEKPLQRLWEAVQIIERFGVPVGALLEWARIASSAATSEQRFEIARDLKEAIKARFEPDTWQRVAQPIFDRLRRRQRDGLAAHVMHQHGFDRIEQLYEYFLIDPGMEPVVQTSRIRLAISSLQLFIQRCLLNLEQKVHPSTINSKHWEWMKRYRVWEANRKIFLFPENWLEPEFRDDKTHLFAELEGALLQGDVSADLVEDAFLNYLKKLDELARLDIVAMHIEDDADPARRTLHVFGRTYSLPHKYFYRRFAHQMWTPWEPVSAEIEGDHLAPVVWRDRLYLFWVTFMDKPVEGLQPAAEPASTKLGKLTLGDAIKGLQTMVSLKTVEIQLHWSEYLQGEWSTRESGGFSKVMTKSVSASFKPSSVFIHVSKAYDAAGEEGGVYITLGGAIKTSQVGSFYLEGRNSLPKIKGYKNKPINPYNANDVQPTRYDGDSALTVTFKQSITTKSGQQTKVVKNPLSILQKSAAYTLLPCNNDISLGSLAQGSLDDAENANAVDKAIAAGLPEIASLIKPIFYQDNRYTLFVEPNVTERTIEQWNEWITSPPHAELAWHNPDWWTDLSVLSGFPWKPPHPDPEDPRRLSIDPVSLIYPKPAYDWLMNPLTGLRFDDEVIGPTGRAGIVVLSSLEGVGDIQDDVLLANIHAGSDLPVGSVALVPGALLEQAGMTKVAGGLNIVGGGGFNSALAQNFLALNRSRFGAGISAAGTVRR